MKSILVEDFLAAQVEDFLARNVGGPKEQLFAKDENGNPVMGWAMAKPLNYSKEYVSEEDRKAMAQEVLDGHAIAVHFTEDEIALGEVPTLYKRSRGKHTDIPGCAFEETEKEKRNGKE